MWIETAQPFEVQGSASVDSFGNTSSYQSKNIKKHIRVFLKHDTPLIKDAHKATQMSTFPFDYSSFLYIVLQRCHVLLLVQVKQYKYTQRQVTGDHFKMDTSNHHVNGHI